MFFYKENWFFYPHDVLLSIFGDKMNFTNTVSWKDKNGYSWNHLNKNQLEILSKYKI